MIPEPKEDILSRRLEKIRDKSSGTLTFGFLGSIENESKGLEYAFRALSHVKTTLPDFELRVLGPGDPDEWSQLAIQLGIRSQIVFDGVLPSGQPVYSWLDEIDIYLHPRLQDGLPRSLIEAMSRGCPALSSRAGGIPELLPHSVTHEPGNWKELASHLITFAANKDWKLENAHLNFEISKKYGHENLKRKRANFWGNFASYVRKSL
jgi:glycosyltransferase involved in cell wall biosynthesis